MEELTELSKDNLSELEEIKPQFEEIEKKIIDLEEESLYSSEFDNHSAWGPPYELISYICKTYNLRGSCRWHEEGGNADWGHFDNQGELVS